MSRSVLVATSMLLRFPLWRSGALSLARPYGNTAPLVVSLDGLAGAIGRGRGAGANISPHRTRAHRFLIDPDVVARHTGGREPFLEPPPDPAPIQRQDAP